MIYFAWGVIALLALAVVAIAGMLLCTLGFYLADEIAPVGALIDKLGFREAPDGMPSGPRSFALLFAIGLTVVSGSLALIFMLGVAVAALGLTPS